MEGRGEGQRQVLSLTPFRASPISLVALWGPLAKNKAVNVFWVNVSLTCYYKLWLIKLFHMAYLKVKHLPHYRPWRINLVCLTTSEWVITLPVPRSNSYFLKNSISFRGVILWNTVLTHFTDQFTYFYRKVKKDIYVAELDFTTQSFQSWPKHYYNFKCY